MDAIIPLTTGVDNGRLNRQQRLLRINRLNREESELQSMRTFIEDDRRASLSDIQSYILAIRKELNRLETTPVLPPLKAPPVAKPAKSKHQRRWDLEEKRVPVVRECHILQPRNTEPPNAHYKSLAGRREVKDEADIFRRKRRPLRSLTFLASRRENKLNFNETSDMWFERIRNRI